MGEHTYVPIARHDSGLIHLTADCGCDVAFKVGEFTRGERCPLHAAAPRLLAALEELVEVVTLEDVSLPYEFPGDDRVQCVVCGEISSPTDWRDHGLLQHTAECPIQQACEAIREARDGSS